MAEGLEEESKKSLQMEAEMEKQAQEFEVERKNFKAQLAAKDQRYGGTRIHFKYKLWCFCPTFRIIEIETEIHRLKAEYDSIRTRIQLSDSGTAIISSVAKVVQPTATVSSVPVSGPSNILAMHF